jgi:hypothetical protein
MRRQSDRGHGERTGVGRRARDRLLEGSTQSPALRERRELDNLVLFLGDDLRESALAMGGIESFMLRAQQALESPDLTPEELRRLLEEGDVAERMDLLWDALSSLRRSMAQIHDSLKK